MSRRFADIAFTPAVRELQERHGSRDQYARMQAHADAGPVVDDRVTAFLAEADHFYLATVGATGWPYVQHRGGPRGFLRALGPARIGFTDFRGNLQYVSAGNVAGDDRAALIVTDYARQRRLKMLGHLRFVEAAAAEPALAAAVAVPGYPARVERIALIDVVAVDWNCPQHITPRFTLDEVEAAAQPLRERIATLERELATARAR